MHTVRNRRAASPRRKNTNATPKKRAARHEPTFLLRPGESPFPDDLIVPAHRGPVITSVAWPVGLVPLAAPALPSAKAARRTRKAQAARVQTPVTMPPPRPVVQPRPLPQPASERAPALSLPPAPVPPAPGDHPAMSDAETPIPRARALTVRRQGFVEVLAHALAQSLIAAGVRLSRWSASRRRAEAERERVARANARHRALLAQLDALQALRDRVRHSAG